MKIHYYIVSIVLFFFVFIIFKQERHADMKIFKEKYKNATTAIDRLESATLLIDFLVKSRCEGKPVDDCLTDLKDIDIRIKKDGDFSEYVLYMIDPFYNEDNWVMHNFWSITITTEKGNLLEINLKEFFSPPAREPNLQ